MMNRAISFWIQKLRLKLLTHFSPMYLKQFKILHRVHDSTFQIIFIPADLFLKEFKYLDESESTGLNKLVPSKLKLSSDIVFKPLSKIFNSSISAKKYSEMFKAAKITPIFKKGSKSDKNNKL